MEVMYGGRRKGIIACSINELDLKMKGRTNCNIYVPHNMITRIPIEMWEEFKSRNIAIKELER